MEYLPFLGVTLVVFIYGCLSSSQAVRLTSIFLFMVTIFGMSYQVNEKILQLIDLHDTTTSILESQKRIDRILVEKVSRIEEELHALGCRNFVLATVTAYSPSTEECDSTPYTTAFLKKVHPKYVAISRDLLKQGWAPGRRVYIEGIGIRVIGDLMSPKIKGPHVDIFMWKKEDALKFGKSKRYVFLIQE